MKEDGISTFTSRRHTKIVQSEQVKQRRLKLSKNNMIMLFYILLIYQITNCLLLVIDCQCFLTPKIF